MDILEQLHLSSPFGNGKSLTWDPSDQNFGSEVIKFVTSQMGELDDLGLTIPDAWQDKDNVLSHRQIDDFSADFNRIVLAFRNGHFQNQTPGDRYALNWQMGRSFSDESIKEVMALTRRLTVQRDRELEGVSIGTGKYGEMSAEQMLSIVDELHLGRNDVFMDLGSGIGHLVACAAISSTVRTSVGIEFITTRAKKALEYRQALRSVLEWFGRGDSIGEIVLHEGSFLENRHKDFIKTQATVIFVNNYAFRAETTNELKTVFAECQPGTRIVSTAPFVTKKDQERMSRQLRDPLPAKVRLSQLRTTQNNNGFRSSSCEIHMMTVH